jgi:hypothetical protein
MVGFHKPPSGIGNDRQPAKLSNSGKEQANRFADDDAEFLALEISKVCNTNFAHSWLPHSQLLGWA